MVNSIPVEGVDVCASLLLAFFGVSLDEGFAADLALPTFPLPFCDEGPGLLLEHSFVFGALCFSSFKDRLTILSNSFNSRSANSCNLR